MFEPTGGTKRDFRWARNEFRHVFLRLLFLYWLRNQHRTNSVCLKSKKCWRTSGSWLTTFFLMCVADLNVRDGKSSEKKKRKASVIRAARMTGLWQTGACLNNSRFLNDWIPIQHQLATRETMTISALDEKTENDQLINQKIKKC